MRAYNHSDIEKKWQKQWKKERIYEPNLSAPKSPLYNLMMFPYPSAEGLHVGNMYAFVGSDIYGRFKRMQGYDVFEPIGLDGFGIHSENYALKAGTHPAEQAKKSAERFYKQLEAIGNGFAWEERLQTYDSEYYKWTQWIFTQMFKHGLAYRKKQEVNWCPSDKTVLADEQVVDGKCERCGAEVIKKNLEQWFFKITDYAERLLKNLETLDWSERVKIAQRNWIGKSEGAEIDFEIRTKGKPNFVLLHGYGGSPKRGFFPWLKQELEKRGYSVQVPVLPHTDKTRVNEVDDMNALQKQVTFDEDTVLVGHSLGAIVAMKAVEKLRHPIRKLLLVGGFFEPKFRDHDRPFKDTFDWRFDFKKIRANVGRTTILHDVHDDVIPYDQGGKLREALGGELVEPTPAEPHFSGSPKEPSVLQAALDMLTVFTTRPDTLFGATYMVVAPEHEIISNIKNQISNLKEVEDYIKKAKAKSQEERVAEGKEKTGVELKGIKAINPANKEEIPIWVADYVLGSYGTGAIMAVPAHDERDFEFAKKFNLSVIPVVRSEKENCVVVHGCPRDQKTQIDIRDINARHWIPWLKKSLEEIGIRAYNPLMPNAWAPEYSEWKQELEKLPIHEQSVLVGHSCAASFLVRWLGDTKRKINKLVLVAPANIAAEDAREEIKKLYDFSIDEGIRDRVGKVVIFVSDTEKERHKKTAKMFQEVFKAELIEIIGKGHFVFDDMGTVEFPELLQAVTRSHSVMTGEGILVNSEKFNNLDSEKAKWEITKFVGGTRKTQYRLRDWLISRQRYWGPPIPMIFCESCAAGGKGERAEMPGWYAVLEKDLPVELPFIKDFRPTGKDESPLAAHKEFYEVKCLACKMKARRETDVSDTFLDSAWYYLGYLTLGGQKSKVNPFGTLRVDGEQGRIIKSQKFIPDVNLVKRWLPVDMYIGGAEHSVLHLLYVRFFAMAFYDWGLVHFDEPMKKFRAHGLLIKGGAKMSKSKGNVINPDEYIENFGADALRMYLMFIAPFEQGGDFRDAGILGVERFLQKVMWYAEAWLKNKNTYSTNDPEVMKIEKSLNRCVKKVTEDIEILHFNTAISALMIFINTVRAESETDAKSESVAMTADQFARFIKLLAPFAPHMSEEIWRNMLGNKKSIHREPWASFDEKLMKEETFTLVIQVNGRVRDSVEVPVGLEKDEALKFVIGRERVVRLLGNQKPKRIVFVPGKLINIVF